MSLHAERGSERQHHIPGNAILETHVYRYNEDHAIRDDRTTGSNRAAPGGHPINSRKLLGSVEFPDRLTIPRGDGPQHPVHSSRNQDTGDYTYSCDNAAVLRHCFWSLQGREPLFHPIGQSQRNQSIAELKPVVHIMVINRTAEHNFTRSAANPSRDIVIAGSEKLFPVPKYKARRFVSTIGVVQTPEPEGPI